MNIHFKDEDLFSKLFATKIYSEIVGSRMYGFNGIESDIDFLHILPIPDIIQKDIFRTHHQLQFKQNNEDHVFVFLDTFFKNTFNGDSTIINYEVFQEIKPTTSLDWCIKYKEYLNVYTIIRAYLGFAKRDIKYFQYSNDLRSKKRKLKHIYRGYLSAKLILDKKFTISALKNDKMFKKIDNYDENFDFKAELETISLFRKESAIALEKDLDYFLSNKIQMDFNTDYYNFIRNNNYYSDNLGEAGWKKVIELYYDVNVNGLNY